MTDQYTSSTSFEDTTDSNVQVPTSTSGLAIASLVCSLILCCPATTVIGAILGFAAIFTTGQNRKRGRGLAISGLLIGLVSTALWIIPMVWIGGLMTKIYTVPKEVIVQSAAGDYAAAGSQFMNGHAPSDEEFKQFSDEVQKRYGAIVSMQPQQDQQNQTGDSFQMPYVFTFENGKTSGYAVFGIQDQLSEPFVLLSITLEDADSGNLTLEAGKGGSGDTP